MIYVHVPFCRSFCTYCDFYSEIACRGREKFDLYIDGISREILSRREEIVSTLGVKTLYIGGGTPSVLPLSCLGRIAGLLSEFSPFDEFTVEVNPDDITPEYACGLRSLGVNRVSMGVQCLEDGVLKWMNRRHTSEAALGSFRLLRDAGFDNISLDVIFGLSSEAAGYSSDILKCTLDGIIGLRPEHISAYQLSIEDGSALGKMVDKGRYHEASDEVCRIQYELICSRLREVGYVHYEISNWALPGREAVHNSAYWARAPYVGLGPGAHSLMIGAGGQIRSWNSCSLSGWTSTHETLSEEEIREEEVMLGLRTSRGIVVDGNRKVIPESDWFVSDSIILNTLTQHSGTCP